ncbi:MAG TPA: tyrosine-protein phosphatase [Planctomycetota bacterium]|nr:tyrosine-protein phosphatase [Planctomycetota bacterium]
MRERPELESSPPSSSAEPSIESAAREANRSSGRERRGARRWIALALVAVIAAIGLFVWKSWLEDRFIPKRWGVVEEGLLYRSGQLSAALVENQLEKHGIRHIVDLTAEVPGDPDQAAELEAARDLGITHRWFGLGGNGTGDVESYAEAVATMHRAVAAGEPALVHCSAGAQRTGGAVAFYRLLIQGKPIEETVREMASFGWDPDDDVALKSYINDNIGELARILVDKGIIAKVPDPLPQIP